MTDNLEFLRIKSTSPWENLRAMAASEGTLVTVFSQALVLNWLIVISAQLWSLAVTHADLSARSELHSLGFCPVWFYLCDSLISIRDTSGFPKVIPLCPGSHVLWF